ncbi:hypothetical protein NE237_032898 [Protea cynaroides]|uniref:Uncharacterized protein n=1 Tax=Protea cynaroides TaxID=273540 RepID=A0A9Q0L4E1_9MAGN|nr:hypothetical protein NE237_032898 [Protea cynaroides]
MGILSQQSPLLEAQELLKLFDSCWFGHEISTENPPSTSIPTDLVHELQRETTKPPISCLPTVIVRSQSDDVSFKMTFKSDSLSPKSVLIIPKLQPILSGKEVVGVVETNTRQEKIKRPDKKKRGMRRTSSTKSLSDLESEELKGFMDLGFVFSEEDKDSNLVSIIPGLQRLGKKSGEKETTVDDESAIRRPYLSEAWDFLDRRREENPLMNWKIPIFCNEIDMKDHLRNWAHSVASTVR